ncbi:hypothetical protein UK23_13670 [Lentzea aerocolonigenes]|uniref:Uncharacterized protein n=2 Tax=Lentzea aerocolonigenes TaxID=68170 RepID=A0A0F0H7C1_LENAE|nr:hypothetical protein UK23_13670 [Lentzea aerocolonigenes]
MFPRPTELMIAEDAGDRAGNVIQVVLLLGAIVVFIVAAVFLAKVAHFLAELVWPLWLTGGIGFLILVGGYIAGSSSAMTTGGIVMATSVGIAIFGYMIHG